MTIFFLLLSNDVFVFCFLFIISCMFVFSVSFFGDSHVAMPLQEAKLSTNIRLQFRSHQTNALLFLAAGRTDYILLSLDDGRIKLNLKINDHQTEVNFVLPKSTQFDRQLKFSRSLSDLVDEQYRIERFAVARHCIPTIRHKCYASN